MWRALNQRKGRIFVRGVITKDLSSGDFEPVGIDRRSLSSEDQSPTSDCMAWLIQSKQIKEIQVASAKQLTEKISLAAWFYTFRVVLEESCNSVILTKNDFLLCHKLLIPVSVTIIIEFECIQYSLWILLLFCLSNLRWHQQLSPVLWHTLSTPKSHIKVDYNLGQDKGKLHVNHARFDHYYQCKGWCFLCT